MSRSLSRLLNRMKRDRAAAPPFDRRRQTGICFFYGLGDADRLRDRLRNVLVGIERSRLAVDDPASVARPLFKRAGWRRIMRTLEPGDVEFLIDAIALGPTWRLRDRTFEQVAKLKARVVVVLSDHSTIDLSTGSDNAELERIRQEALDDYHRQRIRDGLAVARAAGKRVGRPPFGWPCAMSKLFRPLRTWRRSGRSAVGSNTARRSERFTQTCFTAGSIVPTASAGRCRR
ncbi:MAG: hypothetical protein K8U03_03105 [Planctomycetia bacterium]|nr:hypothetical protein [Planctomycetia bacterium]